MFGNLTIIMKKEMSMSTYLTTKKIIKIIGPIDLLFSRVSLRKEVVLTLTLNCQSI